jgi:hypothetical protein
MLAAIPFWDAGCAGLKRHLLLTPKGLPSSRVQLRGVVPTALVTQNPRADTQTTRTRGDIREGPGFSNIPRLVGATSGSAV